MDLQPDVSTTPLHALAPYPQRHHNATGLVTPFTSSFWRPPLARSGSPGPCLRVVARLELHGSSGRVQPPFHSTFFFFFFWWVREVALPPKP